MRICYYADGRYIHAERWMRFFAERGHEMHLISFAELEADRIAALEEIGITYHGATGNFHIKKFWETLRDLRFIRSVLKREKFDVLHCHFLTANCWYTALSGFHPYVITIMGGGDVTGPGWKPDGNTQSRYLTPYALRNADYITSWSHFMADVVRPFIDGTPIEVVHGGIHLERFTPGPKREDLLEKWSIPVDAPVVFSPRLMRPLSNILEIAKAAHMISAAIPNTHYVVAFPTSVIDTDYGKSVQEAFAAGVAKDNVRFVSEISHTEIADYFRLADVTVSVPITDGTPMTVLESMACGTPAVIGNLPDYDVQYFEDGKTVVMVDVNDPRSIADGVMRILKEPKLATRIAAEARRRVVETGSYEYQMGKMEDIYRKLVGDDRRLSNNATMKAVDAS